MAATRSDYYWVLLSDLEVEDGYNVKDEDLNEVIDMATSIAAQGVRVPVHAYQKQGSDKFTLIDGHTRYAGCLYAADKGLIDRKTFKLRMVKESKMSDIDRTLCLITFNSGKGLTAIAEAKVYERAIKFGATIKEIIEKLGANKKSEQHIKNMLLLLTAGKATVELIKSGVVKPTLVIDRLKKITPGDLDKELTEHVNKIKSETLKVGRQLTIGVPSVQNSIDDDVPTSPTRSGDKGDNSKFSYDDDDMPKKEDNTKTAGPSGMNLGSDSSKPIRITKKSLAPKKPDAPHTYTKEFLLNLLIENGVSEDEVAYGVLNSVLK